MSNPYPTQQYPGGYQPPTGPPAAPLAKVKKPRKWPWILGILVAFGLGAAVGGSGGSTPTPATSGATTTTVTKNAPAPVTVTAPAAAQAPAAPPAAAGPATSFGDGTFKVGTDIAAGSYKTSGPRAGSAIPMCYWARLRDDTGSNIIANDNSQGPTRFTTKVGEYVQITGCDFVKS